jgi:hypothetical protein
MRIDVEMEGPEVRTSGVRTSTALRGAGVIGTSGLPDVRAGD